MQGRYKKTNVVREELRQEKFSMDSIIANFALVSQSPAQAFIQAYKAMLKTAEKVNHHGRRYTEAVKGKHAAMANALAAVEHDVLAAEQVRVQFQVNEHVLELYSKEIRKIREAEHHIDMVDSGMRLGKWKHARIDILAQIADLNKQLHCCEELKVLVEAGLLRDRLEEEIDQAGCFGKKTARDNYTTQVAVVKELQRQYNENAIRVQINELQATLKKVEAKIEFYTNHAGEFTDNQKGIIRDSESRIEDYTRMVQEQFISHYSKAEPVCLRGMVKLYAMFMQFKNDFDHSDNLAAAKEALDACMHELRCDDFKNTDAMGVYEIFLSGLSFNANRFRLLDGDMAKLDHDLKIPYTVHAHTTQVTSSNATMFSTSMHTHKETKTSTVVAESTATKRTMFAASKTKSGNPLPVNDDKGKQEEDAVQYIGPRN